MPKAKANVCKDVHTTEHGRYVCNAHTIWSMDVILTVLMYVCMHVHTIEYHGVYIMYIHTIA